MGVGGRIAELLKEKGMSQKELAERACTSEAAISHYLKGDRVPNSSTLANIATVLGTTSSYLLGEDEDVISFSEAKRLLARNAAKLSQEERMELIKILAK
jgi:transcriptional regulator with XRE-family HTH domain